MKAHLPSTENRAGEVKKVIEILRKTTLFKTVDFPLKSNVLPFFSLNYYQLASLNSFWKVVRPVCFGIYRSKKKKSYGPLVYLSR